MSRQLRVSISTVSQAYAALQDLGVLRVRPQSGYYVDGAAGRPQDSPVPRKTAVSSNRARCVSAASCSRTSTSPTIPKWCRSGPAAQCRTDAGKGCAAGRQAAARHPERAIGCGFPPGNVELRHEIARRYVDLGLAVDPDNVIVTSGLQRGLALSLQSVTRRGDIVAVESPTWFLGTAADRAYGAAGGRDRFRSGDRGCLDALEGAIETMDIKAVVAGAEFQQSARLADAR